MKITLDEKQLGHLATALWVLLGTLLVALCIHNNPGPDYWYHLFLGKQFLANFSFDVTDRLIRVMPNFLNNYWLYQSIQYLLFKSLGQFGPSLLYISLSLVAAFFWRKSLGTTTPKTTAALALGITALLIFGTRFEWRPEMVSYASLCLFAFYLTDYKNPQTNSSPWRLYVTLGVVQCFWANSHGYFVFGPLLAGVAMTTAFLKGNYGDGRSLLKLLVILVFATLIGPHHVKVWANAFHMRHFLDSMTLEIQEFMPPTHPIFLRVWTVVFFWIIWFATLITICLNVLKKDKWLPTIFAALGLYLSANYYRNIPLLPILSSPLWGAAWLPKTPNLIGVTLKFRTKVQLSLAVVILSLLVTVMSGHYYSSRYSSTRFGLEVQEEHSPKAFADFLNASSFKGSVFNNASDGGYLELYLPQIRPYGDSRFTDRDATVLHFNSLSNFKEFSALNTKHNFDGVLLRILENQVLIHELMKSGAWTLAYTDLHRAFFVSENTTEGSQFLPRKYSFYNGEDIEIGDNLYKAVQWAKFLLEQQRFTLLENALDQYLDLPAIHPSVMAIAVRYYEAKGDTAKMYRLRELLHRVKNIEGADLNFVRSSLAPSAGDTKRKL